MLVYREEKRCWIILKYQNTVNKNVLQQFQEDFYCHQVELPTCEELQLLAWHLTPTLLWLDQITSSEQTIPTWL